MTEKPQTNETQLVERHARAVCRELFTTISPEHWSEDILRRLKANEEVTSSEMERAMEILEGIEHVTDLETFTVRVTNAAKPLLDRIAADPKGYEERMRQQAMVSQSDEKFVINELLHYHLDDTGDIHLHVFPNRYTTQTEKVRMLREGLQDLVRVLEQHPDADKIHALSWIVAENPKLLEMLGFTVTGAPASSTESDIDKKTDWAAYITREDFIAKYKK